MPDVQLFDPRQRRDRPHVVVVQRVPCVEPHPLCPHLATRDGDLLEFRQQRLVQHVPARLEKCVRVRPRVNLADIKPRLLRGLRLPQIRIDERRHDTPSAMQPLHHTRQPFELSRYIQPALGRHLVASLRHQHRRVRLDPRSNPRHFFRRGHLQIELHPREPPQQLDIPIRDVPPILPQMHRDPIRPAQFRLVHRAYGIRLAVVAAGQTCFRFGIAIASLAKRADVVDVDAEEGHKGIYDDRECHHEGMCHCFAAALDGEAVRTSHALVSTIFPPMRVLLATLGSHGDIHPFVAIGKALRARGHDAILLANPYYQALIEGEGIGFAPLSEHADMEKLLRENAQIMDSWRGPMSVLKEFTLPLIPEMAKQTRECLRTFKPDLVLSHPLCFGVSWACEAAAVRCGIIDLSPISWFNPNDTLIMPAIRGPNPSRRTVAFDLWIGKVVTGLMLDGPCNRIRREMGLPKQKAIVYSHSQGGIINLGMWSQHLRGPLPGDPAAGVICGFPWFDRRSGVERETEDLMKFVEEGEPPIVFTMGTTMVHLAGQFFTRAAETCRELGRRGVLLVGRNEYFNPTSLPANVRAFAYAPYSLLLPKAAATVHHGGIGSTAQALRAGRPTVVIPAAHDQFDNAARVKRLGMSETVPVKKVTTKRLVAALRAVLDDPAFAARATSIGAKIAAEDGAGKAVSEIERASKAT